jgi:hypothetical protein
MSEGDTYIEKVLEGTALWTDIDDYIERWHDAAGDSGIEDFLGMTKEDYGLFVEQPRSLRFILAAHESNESVVDLLETADDHAIAARGLDPADAAKVRQWLKSTGRLPSD